MAGGRNVRLPANLHALCAYRTTHTIGLFVMGAYGHSKIRECLLGSTTTKFIRQAKIPVLLLLLLLCETRASLRTLTNKVNVRRMEKRTPHSTLAVVKSLVEAGQVRTTHAARTGATALGLSLREMLDTVLTLTPAEFYKSMTTHADHTVWQDVYRTSTRAGWVYLKLTVVDDVLIVSFKEL